MRRLYLPLILFLLLVLEGVAYELLPSFIVSGDSLIIPHWVLILLVLTSLFYDKEHGWASLGYALLFGFLIDIAYTGILGVYMFAYGIAIYVIHGLRKYLQTNFYTAILHGILAMTIADVLIDIIYGMVGLNDMMLGDYLMFRLVPTILANLVFLIVLYPTIQQRLVRWGKD